MAEGCLVWLYRVEGTIALVITFPPTQFIRYCIIQMQVHSLHAELLSNPLSLSFFKVLGVPDLERRLLIGRVSFNVYANL